MILDDFVGAGMNTTAKTVIFRTIFFNTGLRSMMCASDLDQRALQH